jgi:hypothetical protein
MPRLDKDNAALLTERLMQTQVRTSNPRSRGITPMLIFKYTLHYKDFLASVMFMGVEIGLWRPPH